MQRLLTVALLLLSLHHSHAWIRHERAVNTSSSSSSASSDGASPLTGSQDIRIGVGCKTSVSYPSDANVTANDRPRFSYVVENPIAEFISLHFARFNLPPDDFVLVRANEGSESQVLKYYGRDRNTRGDFFSRSLRTKSVTLELYTSGSTQDATADGEACAGFLIDNYRFLAAGASFSDSEQEELCGADDSEPAACFLTSPEAYQRANAVIRLLIHKPDSSYFCTGWLLGCEGHVVTNHHCISEPAHAKKTEFEFRAQGRSCAVDCDEPFACEGQIRATTSEFVVANKNLDYALVKLAVKNVWNDYGFLQMRESGAVKNERIYIPQHPGGWGKRIAMKDGTDWGKVLSLNRNGCLPNQVAYSLDTQGGSSGSPVLSWSDNVVVALHHCGGCPNTAINSNKIIADLRARGLLPQCAVYEPAARHV